MGIEENIYFEAYINKKYIFRLCLRLALIFTDFSTENGTQFDVPSGCLVVTQLIYLSVTAFEHIRHDINFLLMARFRVTKLV